MMAVQNALLLVRDPYKHAMIASWHAMYALRTHAAKLQQPQSKKFRLMHTSYMHKSESL